MPSLLRFFTGLTIFNILWTLFKGKVNKIHVKPADTFLLIINLHTDMLCSNAVKMCSLGLVHHLYFKTFLWCDITMRRPSSAHILQTRLESFLYKKIWTKCVPSLSQEQFSVHTVDKKEQKLCVVVLINKSSAL